MCCGLVPPAALLAPGWAVVVQDAEQAQGSGGKTDWASTDFYSTEFVEVVLMLPSCIVCSSYFKADRWSAYTILWVTGVEGVYNKRLLCACHRIKEMCCGLSECCTALPVEFCLFIFDMWIDSYNHLYFRPWPQWSIPIWWKVCSKKSDTANQYQPWINSEIFRHDC